MTECQMPPRRSRLRTWIRRLVAASVVLVLLAGAAVGFGLPALARTSWAREQAEARLARLFGGTVSLERLRFSWDDGVSVRNLSIQGTAGEGLHASLKVGELRLKPDYKKMGARARATIVHPTLHIRESIVYAEGQPLRLPALRRGALQIDRLDVADGVLTYSDESSPIRGKLTVTEVNLRGAAAVRRGQVDLRIATLNARLNGGEASCTGGRLSLSPGSITGEVAFSATKVESNELIARALRHLLPVLEGLPPSATHGRLDLSAHLSKAGPYSSWAGSGKLALSGVDLRDSSLLAHARLPRTDTLASARAVSIFSLDADQDKVHGMITLGREGAKDIRLNGWVGVRDSLDYHVAAPGTVPVHVWGRMGDYRLEPPLSDPF